MEWTKPGRTERIRLRLTGKCEDCRKVRDQCACPRCPDCDELLWDDEVDVGVCWTCEDNRTG